MPKQPSMRALFSGVLYDRDGFRRQCSGVRKFYAYDQALRFLNESHQFFGILKSACAAAAAECSKDLTPET